MGKKLAVITGGSSGLGYCIAAQLATKNYALAILSRNSDRAAEAAARLRNEGASVRAMTCDVGDHSAVQAAFATLDEEHEVELLVNAAGVGRFGAIDEISRATLDEVFQGNLTGLILASSTALQIFGRRNKGTIVSILSTAALVGREKEAAYCAAKWGARGFMEAVRAATKGTGIRTLTVYTGGMDTPFWNEGCGMTPDVSKFMRPEDVAQKVIAAIFSGSGAYVTETTISRG